MDITKDLIQRVFHIGYQDELGTAFTIEHNNKQYLVSAKHIFEDVEDMKSGQDLEVTIFHDKKWKPLLTKLYIHELEHIDIIIFSFSDKYDLSFRYPLKCDLGGNILGQDTYFLGFPYGIFMKDDGSINRKFPIPFVKKATLSAIISDTIDGDIIYLDGHTNKGFSGGPVIFYDYKNKEVKVAGVMRGYLKDEKEIEIGDEYEVLKYNENSGIILVQSISHIFEIFEKNNL